MTSRILKNVLNRLFITSLMGINLSGAVVYAQDSSANGSVSAEVSQFQNWLKNNGEAPTAPVPSSVPPPAPSGQAFSSSEGTPPIQMVQSQPPSSPPPNLVGPRKSKNKQPLTFSESQQVMLNSAPPSPPPTQDSKDAFQALTQQNMPMTPRQVVQLRQLIDVSQRASAILPNVPPKPVSSTLMINLAPGATPPAIRLAQGYVTSLVFVDSLGSPWPIAAYDIGDPKATNMQWDNKSNILLIQAVAPYGDSNLVVRLVGLATPITLQLVSGQRVVDYRADIHVSGVGPNSKDMPMGTQLPESANQLLLDVLDGIAPSGSRMLYVRGGGDCQAWLMGDKMYLRTRFTLLSPGWVGKMSSPDGMNAYELPRTSSILISQYGEPVGLKVEGF